MNSNCTHDTVHRQPLLLYTGGAYSSSSLKDTRRSGVATALTEGSLRKEDFRSIADSGRTASECSLGSMAFLEEDCRKVWFMTLNLTDCLATSLVMSSGASSSNSPSSSSSMYSFSQSPSRVSPFEKVNLPSPSKWSSLKNPSYVSPVWK